MLFIPIGGILGSLYGYLSMGALIPALIASDIPVPLEFISTYQERYFYGLLPIVWIFGWWTGKWRATQIETLDGWRKWIARVLLASILAVLGYAASVALFFLTA